MIFAKASRDSTAGRRQSHLTAWDRPTRTLEAFADAIDSSIQGFDKWCAAKEEEICLALGGIGPERVVSLLSLEKSIRDEFSDSYFVILEILQEVTRRATRSSEQIREVWTLVERSIRISSSVFVTLILDMLHAAAQDRLSMGDLVASRTLMIVFSSTAEPIWSMIQHWIRDGMRIQDLHPLQNGVSKEESLDDEFFIEDNGLNLLDPDFWTEGFTLRDNAFDEEGRGSRLNSIPTIFSDVSSQILSAGKAIGLLRVLGVTTLSDLEAQRQWLASWKTFKILMQSSDVSSDASTADMDASLSKISTHNLSQLIHDELISHCQLAQSMLTQVLTEECDLLQHLHAMEDLFLMRRGDAMSHFVDVVFTRVSPFKIYAYIHLTIRDIIR